MAQASFLLAYHMAAIGILRCLFLLLGHAMTHSKVTLLHSYTHTSKIAMHHFAFIISITSIHKPCAPFCLHYLSLSLFFTINAFQASSSDRSTYYACFYTPPVMTICVHVSSCSSGPYHHRPTSFPLPSSLCQAQPCFSSLVLPLSFPCYWLHHQPSWVSIVGTQQASTPLTSAT